MIDISIKGLRESGATPHWFGLGFVQLKLNEKQRMHFWHPSCSKNISDEEVHNHRYSFTSKILVGEMIHEVYEYTSAVDGETECVQVSCKPNQPIEPLPLSTGFLKMIGHYKLGVGSTYFFPANGFHRTITKKAVTLLCRGEIESDYALVLRPINSQSVCPFSVEKSQKECWDIIEDLLAHMP